MALDEIVEELRAGGRLDSSATFTIDLERAADKLGRLQLQLPGLYLVKLVQACLATRGCREIRIQIRGSETFFFARMRPDLPVAELRLAIEQPFDPPEDAACAHMAIACQAALAHKPRRLAWYLFDGKRGWRSDGEVEPLNENPHVALRLERAGPGVGNWLRRLIRARSGEHDVLSERCAYAPVRVFLDGRILNQPWRAERLFPPGNLPGVQALFLKFSAAYPLARAMVIEAGPRIVGLPVTRGATIFQLGDERHEPPELQYSGQGLLMSWMFNPPVDLTLHKGEATCPSPGRYLVRPAIYDDGTLVGHSVELEWSQLEPYLSSVDFQGQAALACRALLLLPAKLDGVGRLIPVLHGVALDAVEVDLGLPGLIAVVAADDLETDLSQTKVVENDDFRRLAEWTRAYAARLRAEVGPCLGHLTNFDYSLKSYIVKRL